MARRPMRCVAGLPPLVAAISILFGISAVTAGAAPASPTTPAASSASAQAREVEITTEAGVGGGVFQIGVPMPLRVSMTSPRSRQVTVMLSTGSATDSYTVDLLANTRFDLDLALQWSPWIDIMLTDPAGRTVGNRSVTVVPDSTRTAVGVGKALVARGTPDRIKTIGGIQDAVLVSITDDLLARPSALESLSGIVLGAGDLDRLDPQLRDRLRTWVWNGGELILDVPPAANLPVIDMPATGAATPIGAGWVRFSSGAVESGQWDNMISPALVRGGGSSDPASNSGMLSWTRMGQLVRVKYISTLVVMLAVFGSALVGGPLLWAVLRTRRRRQLMWVAAPGISILIAGLLLVAGQGVFTDAATMTRSVINATPWTPTGTIASGLRKSTSLELPNGSVARGLSPAASMKGSGANRIVTISLARNSFGSIELGGVTFDKAPRIELSAKAIANGEAQVTVTNKSNAPFTRVSVTGNGRLRRFNTVDAGKSETLPFKMTSDISILGELMLDPGMGDVMDFESEAVFAVSDPATGAAPPVSRGLVMVSGYLNTEVSAVGLKGRGRVAVRALVPVAPPDSAEVTGGASTRVELLGGLSSTQAQNISGMAIDQDGDQGFDSDVPSTVVPGADPTQPPIGPEYVRISSPGGRPAGTCGVSTMAPELALWDGSDWVPMTKSGAPRPEPGLLNVQSDPLEVQDWELPALAPGDRLYVRVTGRIFQVPLPLIFACGGAG